MPTETRKSNKNADFKVYYSKKVPRQKYLPHQRKTVRERPSAENVREPRQMTFLPEKMKTRSLIRDSKEDSNGEEGEPLQRSSKRTSDAMEESHVRPIRKRRRFEGVERTLSSRLNVQPDAEEDGASQSQPSSDESDIENRNPKRRRQSTMTQIASGRKPTPGAKEPGFQPTKRASRASWGRHKSRKSESQRTLTQMIPGLTPSEDPNDQDSDNEHVNASDTEQDESGADFDDAMMRQMTQSGSFQPRDRSDGGSELLGPSDDNNKPNQTRLTEASEHGRSAQRLSGEEIKEIGQGARRPRQDKTTAVRFAQLATPEKRRIREIASSQSPAESLLSTQSSPEKNLRSPLKDRSINTIQETPSKRRHVTFLEDHKQAVQTPTSKREVRIIVQDSDDDDDAIIEEVETNAGVDIGAETQAMLAEIDQACCDADMETTEHRREPSEELGAHPPENETAGSPSHRSSMERGNLENAAHQSGLSTGSVRRRSGLDRQEEPQNCSQSVPERPQDSHNRVEDNALPSTPVVIKDEPSDEEFEPTPPPPSSRSLHPTPHELSQPHPVQTDLDDATVDTPHYSNPAQEDMQSDCSGAEQQLHEEFTSYTQHRRAPPSSSMHVAHDSFSYQATPFPASVARAQPLPQITMSISQATTVDSTQMSPKKTPKRTANQPVDTTPRRTPNTQGFISPQRPPPLFIPSSYPTPGKAGNAEGNSPVFGTNMDGFEDSVENFSIPPLPPLNDEDEE